jgi:hypothetical protein
VSPTSYKPPTAGAGASYHASVSERAPFRLGREVAQKIVEPCHELFSIAHDLVLLFVDAVLRAKIRGASRESRAAATKYTASSKSACPRSVTALAFSAMADQSDHGRRRAFASGASATALGLGARQRSECRAALPLGDQAPPAGRRRSHLSQNKRPNEGRTSITPGRGQAIRPPGSCPARQPRAVRQSSAPASWPRRSRQFAQGCDG